MRNRFFAEAIMPKQSAAYAGRETGLTPCAALLRQQAAETHKREHIVCHIYSLYFTIKQYDFQYAFCKQLIQFCSVRISKTCPLLDAINELIGAQSQPKDPWNAFIHWQQAKSSHHPATSTLLARYYTRFSAVGQVLYRSGKNAAGETETLRLCSPCCGTEGFSVPWISFKRTRPSAGDLLIQGYLPEQQLRPLPGSQCRIHIVFHGAAPLSMKAQCFDDLILPESSEK